MRIIIEDEVTTSKNNFFAVPFKTFKFQTLPTKKFIIPFQQREYDWPKGTSINELLEDLDQHLLNLPPGGLPIPSDPATNSNYYYSGTILCENQNNDTLKLIDGQQRITTLYLLNFTAYLLTKLRFYTIPPMSPAKYQRELTNRFNTFTKWEARCFIKQGLTDDLANLDDEESENNENTVDKKQRGPASDENLNSVNKSILNRIGDKRSSPEDDYWLFLEPRLGFSDTVVITPKFMKAIYEAEIETKNNILTFHFDRDNPYSAGINIIIKHLNDKIADPKPNIDESTSMMLEYIEYYISHLAMTCIISENENDSFMLFEILNERGQDITALDLLKNLIKEREQIPGATAILDFPQRWRDIKRNVKETGARGKADSNFVKFLIRSEANTAEKKYISYLRTNTPTATRPTIFCNESISHFFLRLQKCSELIYELHGNATQDPTTNSSPFDNDKHSCFQYATFMRMIGYDWGQQVIIGSNILHLVSSGYSSYPNPSLSINDNHPNNWKQTNSNPANPDLKHFQRFLGDIMLKIGLIGVVNKLSSNVLPSCSKAILDKIIHHTSTFGVNCASPVNLRLLINDILACANTIINTAQKSDFNNRLISDFLVDTGTKKNIAKIILYLIYTRTYIPTFNCPELEHFEPNRDRVPGPPFYNKGDRLIMISRLGNFFLIDRALNNDFSNRAVYDKLNLARTVYATNPMIITNLFQNVDYTRTPPVTTDPIHGNLPLIKKATTVPAAADDSFESDNTPTEIFFDRRTELLANLASNYIFDPQNFIHTNTPYL
jgi:uncharacterized protein with ParB-like and HNH nuclease domain